MKLKFLFVSILFFSLVAEALPVAPIHLHAPRTSYLGRLLKRVSFTESWSRYPSPDAILNLLKQDFPYASRNFVSDAHCDALSANNRKLLGESDPISGRPANEQPNSSFVNWYLNCVSQFVLGNNYGLHTYTLQQEPDGSYTTIPHDRPAAEITAYFTPGVLSECQTDFSTIHLNDWNCSWNSVSLNTQKTFVKKWIELYVGPEDVMQELGIAGSEDEFVQNILNEIEDARIKNDGRYANFGSIDSVRSVTMIIQLLIHLQDTSKY